MRDDANRVKKEVTHKGSSFVTADLTLLTSRLLSLDLLVKNPVYLEFDTILFILMIHCTIVNRSLQN